MTTITADEAGPVTAQASARGRTGFTPLQHAPATNWLRDVILGGQDGLVNILGIVLGVIAAGGSNTILLATGFAAAITESISMGAVGYTSTIADRDHYQAVRRREQTEIDAQPDAERDALRAVYTAKGFSGQLLEQVVHTLTANRDRWLATVLDDVLHLQPVATRDAMRSSVVITGATLLGHLIPARALPRPRPHPGRGRRDRAQRAGPVRRRCLLRHHPRR
ncbi:MAG TPA: VIT1/CCC1 transporter family protein [Mycobacteriales bacterium]|nr:VIT1/CCC1 transporter family protein [Mycobacteriales bacterium]